MGAFAPHPALVPVFGLGSHIVLDMIPHFDFENMKVEIILGFAALAVLLASGVYGYAIITGGVVAAVPDLENLLVKLGKIRKDQKLFPTHSGLLPHGKKSGYFNLGLQFVFSILILGFLIWRVA